MSGRSDKRVASVLLCLAAGILPFVALPAAGQTQIFADVAPPGPLYDATAQLYQLHITNGCASNPLMFCPGAALDRRTMATFVVRAWSIRRWGLPDAFINQAPIYKGSPGEPGPPGGPHGDYFSDVPYGSTQYNYVQKLYELGITGGFTAPTFDGAGHILTQGTFCPGATDCGGQGTLTNLQTAIFVARARTLSDNHCDGQYKTTVVPYVHSSDVNCAPSSFTSTTNPYFSDTPSDNNLKFIQRLGDLNAYVGVYSPTPTPGCTTCVFGESTASTRGTAAMELVKGIGIDPVIISAATLPGAVAGSTYSYQLSVSGSIPPYQLTVSGGSLPAGLSLSSGGLISGTPLPYAGSSTFSVTAEVSFGMTSAPQSFTISVSVPVSVSTTSLPGGTFGAAYSETLAASGGIAPYTNWIVVSGALPVGLSLNYLTGVISGTPSGSSGSFSVTVQDSQGTTSSAMALSIGIGATSSSYCVTITCKEYVRMGSRVVAIESVIPPLSITTNSLPGGTVGLAYSAPALVAAGGTSPYAWSQSGAWPSGLSVNGTTGVISGIPATWGTQYFTVGVTDQNSTTVWKVLSITIGTPTVSLTASPVNGGGAAGTSQTFTFTATDSSGINRTGVDTYLWIGPSLASTANSCILRYEVSTNVVFLADDYGWYGQWGTVGSGGTLSNSRCSVSLASATASAYGVSATVSVPITFTPAFVGLKNVYADIYDNGFDAYWPQKGVWAIGWSSTATPVGGTSNSGQATTFTFTATDPLGVNRSGVDSFIWFTASGSQAANSCALMYDVSTNTVWIYNDAGTVYQQPAALGSNTTISNSQCSTNLLTATRTMGTDYVTVTLPITFTSSFASQTPAAKFVFTNIWDNNNTASPGWTQAGLWTIN